MGVKYHKYSTLIPYINLLVAPEILAKTRSFVLLARKIKLLLLVDIRGFICRRIAYKNLLAARVVPVRSTK